MALQLFSESAHSVRMVVDMTSQIKDMENFFNNDIFRSTSNDEKDITFVSGDIVFKNVNYKYNKDDGKHYALKNVNLTIKKTKMLRWLVILVVASRPSLKVY